MSNPSLDHMTSTKRILRYVKGNLKYGLVYGSEKECHLLGYYDSDYARDLDDKKSTSWLIFFYRSKTIVWSFCKQKVIALSSHETEYIASTWAACQWIWINRFICEMLGIVQRHFDLCIDNKSTIEISRNLIHHGRTKHIDIRYHSMEEKKVELKYVCMDDQLADLFTKSLRVTRFI